MKIVLIGPAYPYRGGIADTNESFAISLQELGHQVELWTFSVQYPNFIFPGKTQYSEDPAPKNLLIRREINSINPFNWIRTGLKLRKEAPDLVIVRFWLPYMAPSLSTITRFLGKKTTKLAFCDNIIPHERRFGDVMLTNYFVKPFDGFITMSSTVYKELEEFTQKKKVNIPHPINLNLPNILNRNQALNKLELDPSNKYVLFFGIVRKYKGLHLLLHSFSTAVKNNPALKLLVVGEFYDDEKEYSDLIDSLNIQDHVIVRNEYVATQDLNIYFGAADLIAQTYITASQSGVTQIALHFEKPILVTDVGGLSEIVKHNKTGYVCNKDENEIAETILSHFDANNTLPLQENILKEKVDYSWHNFARKALRLAESL
ncbi:glycosyltransferase [Luteibaculum oceani]|uniref:Glycosyltransferase n=1 Tax=Luteibaculum oceani TaxID=1294296 RepID=A0A5C6V0S7_9FLAO|nr:glycosyltransferase [Luteibaculum oceani]TXC78470.1 glycosyltransferase [Luteibaculum oceani]